MSCVLTFLNDGCTMDFGLTSSLTYVCMEFGGLLYSEEEYFIVVVDCDWLADVIVDKLYYMKHF